MESPTQDTLPLDLPEPAVASPMVFAEPVAGTTRYDLLPSPIGDLLLTSDGESLTALYMLAGDHRELPGGHADWRRDPAVFPETKEQLRAYFSGDLQVFSVPVAPRGTRFQLQVWRELTTIPYGRTATYGAIANAIGHPHGARAVGITNGRNPIPIIVPCHRVIGSDGSLTGYGGGLPRKEHLLRLERGGKP